MHWINICGDQEFSICNNGYLSTCFISLILILPSTVLLTVLLSYYAGNRNYENNRGDLSIRIRLVLIVLLCLCSFLRFCIYIFNENIIPYTEYVRFFFEVLCWLLYIAASSNTTYHRRQHIVMTSGIFLKSLTTLLEMVGAAMTLSTDLNITLKFSLLAVSVGLYTCYFTTIISVNDPRIVMEETRRTLLINESSSTQYSSYGSFVPIEERGILCEDDSGWISKLIFAWVWKLMNLGRKNGISGIEDLFELPEALKIHKVWTNFCKSLKSQSVYANEEDSSIQFSQTEDGLFKILNRCFWREFYRLAFLKIVADALSFSGPILLNYLVTFLESSEEPIKNGYYYSLGLFSTTLLSAFFSSHFNYLVAKIGMNVRSTVVCLVYRKTMTVSLVTLQNSFTVGQVLNLASSDADRINNFCQSFHQFWSLPLQIGLALYLLYQQIGLAFLAGLAYTLLLIPINRFLAKKIAFLSQERMNRKDQRIKVTNEKLFGIRAIKMHAWEAVCTLEIEDSRKEELKFLKRRQYLDALCVYFWATTPVMISVLTFGTYALMGHSLTAAKTFTCLALFGMLVTPLNAFPWVINGLVESWVSLKRLERFLALNDHNPERYYDQSTDDTKFAILDGVFKWNEDEVDDSFTLGPLNVSISQGQFVGIIGTVGSGKSSFFSCILGNMHRLRGTVTLHSQDFSTGICFVAQEPWIQNATIKENILFGLNFNSVRYASILHACALLPDLQSMPAGDETEVGERGLSLSGGQKSRIALARAIYQDKDIYLLDDPFSAVDVHVGNHISIHCLEGLLKNKTLILSTHHHRFLENVDFVMVFKNGRISEKGNPIDILKPVEKFESESPAVDNSQSKTMPSTSENEIIDYQSPDDGNLSDGRLLEEEEKATGAVGMFVYKSYWKAVGTGIASLVLVSLFLMQASRVFSDGWLTFWISQTSNNVSNSSPPDHPVLYLSVYGVSAIINSLVTLVRSFAFAYGGITAATVIHHRLLAVILKAPINFFDVTPLGRILNRFSSDLNMVDDSLPFILNIFLDQVFRVTAVIGVTCYGLPMMLIIYIPLFVAYLYIQNFYRKTSRDVKRLCSISLSPVYAHFSETLDGLPTIRAMGAAERFCRKSDEKLEVNQRANYAGLAASNWLNFYLQLIGVTIVTSVAVISILQHHFSSSGISPALVGLAVSYALTITSLLSGVVTSFTEVEKEMVSVERITHYIENLKSERLYGIIEPPFSWPIYGVVCFEGVYLQYHSKHEDALSDISFETRPGEKIGIVGRTGSGKSSLLQALFRNVELKAGRILLDGVDISHLDLQSLRSHLAIIPQEPFLFSGTVRKNLDPQSGHEDEDLWRVLNQCQMSGIVRQMGGLGVLISQGGKNFSLGQRQLLCLARALLDRVKVLCLDEATASVDLETDALIQKTLRVAFKGSTVFTVAHRLDTILHCDKVLVMGNGKLLEYGPPAYLAKQTESYFANLLKHKK